MSHEVERVGQMFSGTVKQLEDAELPYLFLVLDPGQDRFYSSFKSPNALEGNPEQVPFKYFLMAMNVLAFLVGESAKHIQHARDVEDALAALQEEKEDATD